MLQPLATPSHAAHSSQWTITYPTLVAPRPLRPSHAYHPYSSAQVGRSGSGSARHPRVPPRLRVVPSPAEALARISLVDQPTPPPDVPDESQNTISTLSSETLEEFLRILQNGARTVTEPEPEKHVSHESLGQNPLASAPAVWTSHARETSKTPDLFPMTAPIARSGRTSSCVVRKRTHTRSQSPTRHDRCHPYRRETSASDKSSKHSRGSSISLEEPPSLIRPSPRRWASKRTSASSSVLSETDVSEPADLGSSQNEDIDVELASNRGDVDDEELLARSADTELDSSTCDDGPKRASVRSRMACTPASPISRRHTSNPLAHYSPMLFETLAARARANVFSPSHSRSPSPTPAPHIADPLDEDEEDADADDYQPASVIRMEMPRSSSP
ncbi:peptidase M24 [Rhizoctonia solani AG-3 Rhs1AP]|uniref:Peptidase M24 n=2 Tax=Rhizoctonia solani AG-3 TaxID=1086053 RepID=A0A074S5F9_9AGAM|nr:peptidase M24 [Rhizoctonia solani AG-3 Rhs1AP]KEP54651.1 peptidase M24 [Rhizoctonia solani 123E]